MSAAQGMLAPMPDQIEGYLSRLAQGCWKDSLVLRRVGPSPFPPSRGSEPTGIVFVLQRPGIEETFLGDNFHDAKQAVHAAVNAERARQRVSEVK